MTVAELIEKLKEMPQDVRVSLRVDFLSDAKSVIYYENDPIRKIPLVEIRNY